MLDDQNIGKIVGRSTSGKREVRREERGQTVLVKKEPSSRKSLTGSPAGGAGLNWREKWTIRPLPKELTTFPRESLNNTNIDYKKGKKVVP